jgi:uncharacterized OB-fold protein
MSAGPAGERAAMAAEEAGPVPPPVPVPDEDSAAFWDGLRRHQVVVQSCGRCGRRRFPPMPGCPFCGAPGGVHVEVAGTGRIYSWVRVHRPLVPAFAADVPYTVAAVDLDGGGRIFARVVPSAGAVIGAEVHPVFVDHDGWTELRFRPAGP